MLTIGNQTKLATPQQTVLGHIERYRMTVMPALLQLSGLKHFGRQRLKALLRNLCQAGELGQDTLYHHKRYFYRAGAEQPPTDTSRNPSTPKAGPLSETAKIRNYALLAFCCLNGAHRIRLTRAELETQFPEIARPGLPLNYYVETSRDSSRLGFVRIDTGGYGRWDRIAAKCSNDLDQHLSHPGVQHFVNRNAIEITLITALPQKADRLREWLIQRHGHAAEWIRIVVFPELLNLIAPPPIKL